MAKKLTSEEREAKKAADKARKEQLKQDYDNRKAELKANALKDIELTSLERFQITAETIVPCGLVPLEIQKLTLQSFCATTKMLWLFWEANMRFQQWSWLSYFDLPRWWVVPL